MPKGIKISPMLNHERLKIIRKGHANVRDLQKFIPASRSKAQLEYNTIAREIMLSEGKEVAWYGIEIDRVLKHYNMTEQDIRRWAKDETANQQLYPEAN
jgi:hypothetical protein